jgi:hypothetical protein
VLRSDTANSGSLFPQPQDENILNSLSDRGNSGAAVTMRFVILAAAIFLLSGFTQAELEKAKNTKEFFKDGYWKCLATEVVRVAPTNVSVQEFSVFVKGACPKERNDFFTSLSNYIVMLHPDAGRDTVSSAANIAVLEAQKDAVTALVDLRSGKRKLP